MRGDAPQTNEPRKEPLPFVDSANTRGDRLHVTNVQVHQRVRPGKYTVRDHDYRLPPSYQLKAEASDPDGNALAYQWFYYPEAGGFSVQSGRSGNFIEIQNANTREASFVVPKRAFKAGSLHVILAVTDNGTPALTRYARVIVNVTNVAQD